MIIPYTGQFLASAMGTEMSLDVCSHKCAYCFSRLNQYKRKSSFLQIINFLKNIKTDNNLSASLIKQGYPICISNRSDPFANTNYKETVALLEILTSMDIGFCIQTKGGKGISDVLEFVKPTCWYFTACSLDDDLMKKIEPGAPKISERLHMIEQIVKKGHRVRVGINPTVPEWVGDKDNILKRLRDIGVYAITLQGISLSGYQRGRLTVNERMLLEPYIKADKKTKNQIDRYLQDFYELAKKWFFCGIYGTTSFDAEIWEPYKQVHKKTMPLITDFFSFVIKNKKHGDILSYQDFKDHVGTLPIFKGVNLTGGYLASGDKNGLSVFSKVKDATFDTLLQLVWADTYQSQCPACYDRFAQVINKKEDAYVIDDKYGLPILMFLDKSDSYLVYEDGSSCC